MKILMIANQFPPMGGSGVQRSSKFAKYLPDFGYTAVVLTRDDINLPVRDDSLLADIDEKTTVIRTKSYDYSNMQGILRIAGKVFSRWILIPDSDILWAKKSLGAALEAIKSNNIKVIYSTSYPYSDHLLAFEIKKRLPDIKWIADFRDEWTNNPYTLDNPHNIVRTNIEKRMERSVLNHADALISNTPVMVKNFISLNNLAKDKFYCIPNGYDKSDFENIRQKIGKNAKFTVTYTGALYGRRRPDTFFEALRQLLEKEEINSNEIVINFIGNYIVGKLWADVESYGLSEMVNIIPYMPHDECLNRLSQSDCLLLIEGTGRGAEAFYTGKIFEYMMIKSPVLAIIPKNGAAAGLISDTEIGTVADFDDIEEIKKVFLNFYSSWKNNETNYSPNYDEISKYERKTLTVKLAEIIKDLV